MKGILNIFLSVVKYSDTDKIVLNMPLIVMTGIPCSGKTTRTNELKCFFESNGKEVHVVSEFQQIIKAGFDKNSFYKGIYVNV